MDRKNDSRPLNQRFFNNVFIAYLGLPMCETQQLKINHKYIAIKRWLDTKLRQVRTWLSRPLNQRFNDVFIAYLCMRGLSILHKMTKGVPRQRNLMTYSLLAFVCVGYLAKQLKINWKYTTIKPWFTTKLS